MQISTVNRSELNPELRLDAEYYKPQSLEVENMVRSKPHWVSGRIFDVSSGPFGSTVTTDKYDQNSELRYIRGKDVFDFFIDDTDSVHIQKSLFDELPQYHLKPLDLLVTVVGMNFGKTALVFPEDCPAIFSCKSSLIRNIRINPFYLTTYLSCQYGYALVRRGQRGAAQPGINLFDLKNIPVPIVGDDFQDEIEKLVIKSRETKKVSEKHYSSAESLLLDELGLNSWTPPNKLTYVRKYSEASQSYRLDAEYFQPKYQAMFRKVSQEIKLDRLGKLVTYRKGFEVGGEAYQDSGIPFWRVSNLTKHGMNDSNANYISRELYEQLKKDYEPKQGEIFLSKDATPGLAFYLENAIQGIVSSGILRLSLIAEIPPHYLELVLNSMFCQMQIEQDAGGSIIKHWKPSEVKKTLIPRLDKKKEKGLSRF